MFDSSHWVFSVAGASWTDQARSLAASPCFLLHVLTCFSCLFGAFWWFFSVCFVISACSFPAMRGLLDEAKDESTRHVIRSKGVDFVRRSRWWEAISDGSPPRPSFEVPWVFVDKDSVRECEIAVGQKNRYQFDPLWGLMGFTVLPSCSPLFSDFLGGHIPFTQLTPSHQEAAAWLAETRLLSKAERFEAILRSGFKDEEWRVLTCVTFFLKVSSLFLRRDPSLLTRWVFFGVLGFPEAETQKDQKA